MHINLKTAKKIAGDKDSSTFRTKEGHEFKVQHRALSPQARKQIASMPKMAEGGYVDTITSGDPIVKAVKGEPADGPNREGPGWSSRPVRNSPDTSEEKYKQSVRDFNAKSKVEQPMAEGGEVETSNKFMSIEEQQQAAKDGKPLSAFYNPKKDSSDEDEGEEPKKYASGGGVSSSSAEEEPDSPDKIIADAQDQSQPPVTINIGQPGDSQGAPPAPAAQAGQDAASALKAILPAIAGGPVGAGLAMAASHPVPPESLQYGAGLRAGFTGEALPPDAQGPSPAGAPSAAPGATSTAVDPSAAASQSGAQPSNPFQAAYEKQMAGLSMGEKAQEMAAKGKEEALGKYNQSQEDATKTYDANIKDAMGLRQQAMQALQDGKIDPNRYWNNKSTGGKISSILGILAAGFNPTSNPNAAIDMLNKEIDRDIDSQKADLGRKQSLLTAANDHFRNIQSAADFHRVLANDLVSHQIDMATAKAATPMAKAELLRMQGELQKQNAVLVATMGARQTLNGTSNPEEQAKALNTLRMTQPEAAKEYEQRIIPGVGTATVPVPEKKREAFAAADTFMKQMDELEQFRQANKGTVLNRGIVDQGHRLAELARNSFRIAQGEGVFKAGSQQFNERLIPDPTDFDFFNKNKAAYGAMKDQAKKEVESNAAVYGIKPAQNSVFKEGAHLPADQKAYLDWARKNPSNPQAQLVLKKLGIK